MVSLQTVLQSSLLSGCDTAFLVHDLQAMTERWGRIRKAFPEKSLHAVAIKANPLVGVLRTLVEAGAGLEAASWEEVQLALSAGCPVSRIVFDSPAKTRDELEAALRLGIRINADNLEELQRLEELGPGSSPIGLRVNPQVGEGAIAMTSVSQRGSKFGVALETTDLPALLERYPWLQGLHVHVGSQGCPLSQLVEGIRRVWEVAESLPQVRCFDLGGGLAVDYRSQGGVPDLEEYALALARACPTMMQGRLPLITEFGRWIQGPCGWVASRVEYVKPGEPDPIAVLHVGADLLLRVAYHPQDWFHRMEVFDPQGGVKQGGSRNWSVVGPLCFGGDVLGRGVALPEMAVGDWMVIRDVGAYTLGMWSRHCSRCLPLVLGWDGSRLSTLKARETTSQVIAFWGG